ncbi:MAG: YcgL domain-containing protein [Proteobacteria bacterium]|nr:YcgL domain-containing protein [Pseudomonadota bacterium]
MNSYIYKSSRKDELYIYLAKKDNFSDVPQALYDTMGKEPIFVMEVVLSSDKQLAREDVNKVMTNLETQGYHVQIPPPIASVVDFKEPAKYLP